jgi:protein-S-isoprenylcysteine O-methyltransferase Ste14
VTLSGRRVPVGYAVGVAVLLLARPRVEWLPLAAALLAVGEALRLWASGHIEKTERLATGGPYAHTRNPLYVGSLLLALGVGVAAASPWAVLLIALYFAVFYPAVVREEAAFLRQRFGAEYALWEAAVPLFLPRLTPAGPRGSRFAWSRVRRNREWHTAAALPLLLAALALWARWRG